MLALKNRIKGISNAFDLWSKADLIQGFVVSPRRLIVPQPKKLQREIQEILRISIFLETIALGDELIYCRKGFPVESKYG